MKVIDWLNTLTLKYNSDFDILSYITLKYFDFLTKVWYIIHTGNYIIGCVVKIDIEEHISQPNNFIDE